MTRFVDVPTLCRLVNRVGSQAFLTGLAAAMREDFCHWQSFEKCARVASHSDIGVIELMPISNAERYAFKYVNGHPSNFKKGVPTVMAFGALADVETGYPVFLCELTLTTAFRTAAASAIAGQALARPASRVMGMIGSGAQAEFQAIGFHTLLGVETIQVFDIDEAAVEKLVSNLRPFKDLQIVRVASARAAARGSDIVTTCTADKTRATILTPDMVEPGMHINGVGGDCPGKTELHVDILRRAKIFVEFEPQTRIEGDIQQLCVEDPVTELWEVLTGSASGRDNEDQVTIFDSVGFALEDYSALRYVHGLVLEFDEGEDIALVPELTDPKNLYAQLESCRPSTSRSNAA